jgi:hypothetical protein
MVLDRIEGSLEGLDGGWVDGVGPAYLIDTLILSQAGGQAIAVKTLFMA